MPLCKSRTLPADKSCESAKDDSSERPASTIFSHKTHLTQTSQIRGGRMCEVAHIRNGFFDQVTIRANVKPKYQICAQVLYTKINRTGQTFFAFLIPSVLMPINEWSDEMKKEQSFSFLMKKSRAWKKLKRKRDNTIFWSVWMMSLRSPFNPTRPIIPCYRPAPRAMCLADARYNRDDDSPPFRLPSNHWARLTNRVIGNFSLLGHPTVSMHSLRKLRWMRFHISMLAANSN